MDYFGYIACVVMGIILGMMGGGGSILTVPILVYLFTIPATIATSYSLLIVGTTSLIGSIIYIRKGDVDFQTSIAFAFPSVVGVNFSRGLLIPKISTVIAQFGTFILTKEILVMIAFATLMIAASYSMILKKKDQKSIAIHPTLRMLFIGLLGLAVGSIAGFVGAGGGFLIIPALVFIAGLKIRNAIGTSLMIISIQSLLGFAGDISRGLSVNWNLLGAVVSCAIIGIIAGSLIAPKIEEQKLKTAFGWIVLIMGLTILSEQLLHLSSK